MAKADHHFLVLDAAPDIRFGFISTAIALLDFKRGLVRAAVLGSAQCTDRTGDSRIDIGTGAGYHTRRERGRVELMLGIEHERSVHRSYPEFARLAPMQQTKK